MVSRIFSTSSKFAFVTCIILVVSISIGCGRKRNTSSTSNQPSSQSTYIQPSKKPDSKPTSVKNNEQECCIAGRQQLTENVFSQPSKTKGKTLFPSYFQNTPNEKSSSIASNDDLDLFAKSLAKLTLIVGAIYNKSTKELTVIGEIDDSKPSINPDDFFVAFRAAYNGQETGVTIDPGPNTDVLTVKHFGKTEDTHHGYVTYAVDLFMKMGGLRFDNHSCDPVNVKVSGFQSELDLMFSKPSDGKSQSQHRFWGEPSIREVKKNRDNTQVLFNVVPHVKTEFMKGDYRDSTNDAAKEYAKFYTDNYDKFEKVYPVFYQLRQLFYLDTLVKWFIDAKHPIDGHWLKYEPKVIATPRTVPAVTVVKQGVKGNFIATLGLYGGVTFDIDNSYKLLDKEEGIFNKVSSLTVVPSQVETFSLNGKKLGAIRYKAKDPILLKSKQKSSVQEMERVPSIQWLWKAKTVSNQSEVNFVNKTGHNVSVQFENTGFIFSIPKDGNHKLELPPGVYNYFVEIPASSIGRMNSKLDLQANTRIISNLSIRTTTIPKP